MNLPSRAAACAAFVGLAAAAFAATSMAARGALPMAASRCAIHEGDLDRWQQGSSERQGRRCESYWADDTSDDARELAAGRAGATAKRHRAAPPELASR